MKFYANCKTTAMGNLPHTDIEEAMNIALSVDVPFFPQLPKLKFQEDLYVLASENFPGIKIDFEKQNITFDADSFNNELPYYLSNYDCENFFKTSQKYSSIYNNFLSRDLSGYSAIRGQLMGPMSFGFRVFDNVKKPIIYTDSVRELLFDFLAKKLNIQYKQLKEKNENVFLSP